MKSTSRLARMMLLLTSLVIRQLCHPLPLEVPRHFFSSPFLAADECAAVPPNHPIPPSAIAAAAAYMTSWLDAYPASWLV